MSDRDIEDLEAENKQLLARIDELEMAITRALDDMGEDGQGVHLATKRAMQAAVGEGPAEERAE